ncbi:MAG: hypothetical protein ICV73_00165 [Acetobacteraceae bacterium]|nr:hypothetical protein [Acetobacteraceae bacterium]
MGVVGFLAVFVAMHCALYLPGKVPGAFGASDPASTFWTCFSGYAAGAAVASPAIALMMRTTRVMTRNIDRYLRQAHGGQPVSGYSGTLSPTQAGLSYVNGEGT